VKKILYLLMLVLSIQSICFAEDIYIGDNNNNTAIYLRTESVRNDIKFITGIAKSTASISYKVIGIPNDKKLEELRELCFDNNITHSERSYKVLMHYDRITKEWATEVPYVTIEESTLRDINGKVLFNQTINTKFVCALNSNDPKNTIHIDTFNEVLKYLRVNKESWHYTYDK